MGLVPTILNCETLDDPNHFNLALKCFSQYCFIAAEVSIPFGAGENNELPLPKEILIRTEETAPERIGR